MNTDVCNTPLPNTYVDDEEIRRYAALLDSLNIGLAVYSPDSTPFLYNQTAAKLLEIVPPTWINEDGLPIADDEYPLNITQRTAQPVTARIMALTSVQTSPLWLSVNTLPIFAENGNVRWVMLTLTNVNEERRLRQENQQLAHHDPLTGVYNQRHIMRLLENEIHRARRYGTSFSIALLDLDHFLPLCAVHGQSAGEGVLSSIGKLFKQSMREMDIAGRIGNDVFLLILPNVSLNEAMVGLERLRALIENQELTAARLKVTVSGGISEYTGESSATLIERCNSLLTHARDAGRNRLYLDMDFH